MKHEGIVDPRFFVGQFSTGLGYADLSKEVDGDYKKLAFLSFSTLELVVEKGCPPDLRVQIEVHAKSLQDRRGERYPTSTSSGYIILGSGL